MCVYIKHVTCIFITSIVQNPELRNKKIISLASFPDHHYIHTIKETHLPLSRCKMHNNIHHINKSICNHETRWGTRIRRFSVANMKYITSSRPTLYKMTQHILSMMVLGCNTPWICSYIPMFQRNIASPSSSGLKMETVFVWNFGTYL
jgi:hypothetical protein